MIWDPPTVTVGEHVVSEGLADAFARQLYGDEIGRSLMGRATRDDAAAFEKVVSGLGVTGMMNFTAWVHGDEAAARFGAEPMGVPAGAAALIAQNRGMETSPAQHDKVLEQAAPVRFDTKVAVFLRSDLLPWQKLNVTAFLMSGIATSAEGLVGEPYRDRDGNDYLPMLRQPVLVFEADGARLASARVKALERGMAVAVYTHDLFSTPHDEANRAAVAAVSAAELDLVGLAIRGPRNGVDRITKGASKHA